MGCMNLDEIRYCDGWQFIPGVAFVKSQLIHT